MNSSRILQPYTRSHTTSSYAPAARFAPQTSWLSSALYDRGRESRKAPLPYLRTWTGFSAVVAVHPSQLRRRRERRFAFLEPLPEREAFEMPTRVCRVSSTIWETPKGGDRTFADVVNTPERFKARIDLAMFEYFERDEIDVNLYGYDILIYACKDNPHNPNRPERVLNRQYRLPDDIDLKTVRLDRHKTKSEVGVDARKIPCDYGKPIMFRITDVTAAVKSAEKMRSF